MPHRLLFLLLLLLLVSACRPKTQGGTAMSAAFEKSERRAEGQYDLDEIRRGGELIIATLSGPDTYYDYHGMPMGHQYALAEDFAEGEGLKVRVEIAPDTAALLRMMVDGEIDVLALPLPAEELKRAHLEMAGVRDSTGASWGVKPSAQGLAAALRDWYDVEVEDRVEKTEVQRVRMVHHVSRRARAVYLSQERGIISVYDDLFKQAAVTTGWDWKLIAAQAYQESAFDPNARSWAGAQGLMQLMPRTAAELGLAPNEVNNPRRNVEAAARYIQKLTGQFSDIRAAGERIKFVLAAYNGGAGHIRDAMALTRKYGQNPQRWDDVSRYVLALQQPAYYRDPVVRNGYMIGAETEDYVRSILRRYEGYGGQALYSRVSQQQPSSSVQTPHNAPKKNKYSSGVPIYAPDDPTFNQMHP